MGIANFVEKQVKILTDPVKHPGHCYINQAHETQTSPSLQHQRNQLRYHSELHGDNSPTCKPSQGYKTTSQEVLLLLHWRTHIGCVCAVGKNGTQGENFLKEKGACFRCLCIGHISKNYQGNVSCLKCGQKHLTVLHKDSVATAEPAERSVSSGLTGAGEMDCKLLIVPVQVKAKKGNKIILTYAFLDQGSTAVFCTESLKQKLNLSGKRANILLRTMG